MTTCCVCGEPRAESAPEASVASNVRRFRNERFVVWRCDGCGSLHAKDDVDLAHYYAGYPFHRGMTLDWRLRLMYRSLLGRLLPFGLRREHTVLDYGCGGGLVVAYLRERGFAGAVGYDEYSTDFADPALLDARYDLVLSQDVLEHVPDPEALLDRFDTLAKPGGLVAIGTPNATAIDLARADAHHHTLHQPYHRHIYSEAALLDAGRRRGWTLERYYPSMYVNTPFPFVNQRFILHYFACFDDTLDVGFDPPSVASWKLYLPMTLFWALFGWFFRPRTDVMVVFRRPR